jgi:hypothetical protein
MSAQARLDRGADKLALATVAGFLLARLLFAAALGLGVDESYGLALARRLDLSYFDHPPLHQWVAHFAALVFGETKAARAPFVVAFAATGWLLYLLTRRLFTPRAGLIALFALNATPFFFASAGSWIVPDGVLLLSLAGAALALSPLVVGAPEGNASWRLWIVAGFCLGLAGLSKYSAALFVVGLAIFVVSSPRQRAWLRRPEPYVAAGIALAMIAPVLIWNARHGWVSFAFQGARGVAGAGLRPLQLAQMALGEIAYLSPWMALPLIAGILSALRERGDEGKRFLLCLALPPILIFTLTPLWGTRGLPHWPMPGWFFAFPLAGAWLDERASEGRLERWAIASAALLALIAVVAASEADTGWLPRLMPQRAMRGDPLLESFAWRDLRQAPLLAAKPAFVLAMQWSDAGKIAIALGPETPVLTLSDDPRGMAYLYDSADFIGKDGVLIAPKARAEAAIAAAKPYFAAIGTPERSAIGRLGRPEIPFELVPLRGLTRALPMPYPGARRP